MWRVGFKFGLAASIVLVGWTMMENELGLNSTKHEIGQYTRMITPLIFYFFIYIALTTRKSHQANVLFFKHGLQSGALTTVIYAALSTCWYYVYTQVINQFFYSSLRDFTSKQMVIEGVSTTDILEKLKELEMSYGGSLKSYVMYFMFTITIGMIVTLILSYFLRTKKQKLSS